MSILYLILRELRAYQIIASGISRAASFRYALIAVLPSPVAPLMTSLTYIRFPYQMRPSIFKFNEFKIPYRQVMPPPLNSGMNHYLLLFPPNQ